MQLNHCFPECSFTNYGPNCNTSCSEYCKLRMCNHTTGHCLTCADDRFGNLCENELPAKGECQILDWIKMCFNLLFKMFHLIKKVLFVFKNNYKRL